MPDTMDVLNEVVWTQPRDYGGFSPVGHYVIASQNRDSDALARSNYRRIFDDLKAIAAKHDGESDDPSVYDWRAGHWACGWIEYLMVAKDAPDAVLNEAAAILCALSEYPVYDESDYSELEYSEASDYWSRMDVKERARVLQQVKCGASIFAARRNELPQDDNGALIQYLTSN